MAESGRISRWARGFELAPEGEDRSPQTEMAENPGAKMAWQEDAACVSRPHTFYHRSSIGHHRTGLEANWWQMTKPERERVWQIP